MLRANFIQKKKLENWEIFYINFEIQSSIGKYFV
jgi:hypothetical protein